MSPGGHLVTTAAACAATAALTQSIPLTLGIAAGGFLIDVDHAVDYVLFEKQRNLRPDAFLRYYVEGRVRRAVLMLHSYECFALLGVLAWLTDVLPLWGYLLGALMHLALDITFNGEYTPRSISAFYSFSYRLAHGFRMSELLALPECVAPAGFWAAFFRGPAPQTARDSDVPMTLARRRSAPSPTAPWPETRPRARLPAPMRVLVVEDEEAVGDVFLDYLLELGHQPSLVRSAEAALGQLQTERPDAIILDIHLPGMSGIDFLQLRPIRESGVPIVAVSGVATESQARECLRLGALDFVGKPVPLERLNDVLGFIEPHALNRRLDERGTLVERRRSRRIETSIPVRVTEYNGAEWQAMATNLSPFGIKVQCRAPGDQAKGANAPLGLPRPGNAVKLSFAIPDSGPPMQIMSLLVRQDADGFAFFFVNLTASDFRRLTQLLVG